MINQWNGLRGTDRQERKGKERKKERKLIGRFRQPTTISILFLSRRAMKAPRSTNRLAPYINLARHFVEKKQHAKALAQLYAGEQEDPQDEYVKLHISQLEKLVNSDVARILKEKAFSFSGEESPAR